MTYQTYEQITSTNTLVQCFVGAKAVSSESRRPIAWKKPRLAKFISIIACAGGGGGGSGNGNIGASVTAGGGGGSGGSHFIFLPAFYLPDTLYISAGFGGLGGSTNGSNGSSGGYTLVSLDNKSFSSYSSHIIFTNPGTGGFQGSVGGSGGAGGAVNSFYLSSIGGLRRVNVGIQGRSGANAAANSFDFTSLLGINNDHLNSMFCGPGAGGGPIGTPVSSTLYDGGSIVLGPYFGDILGSTASSGLNGMNGFNADFDLSMGIPKYRGKNVPLFFSGGAGGGAGAAPGKGGDGGYGSGGGGGGAATSAGTFASGGNGGPGLVIITSTL